MQRTLQQVERELRDWQGFEATCQEDYDHACQKVKELRAELRQMQSAHRCGFCGRGEPTDGSFLGFHAHNRSRTGEVCDTCAETAGCNCCHELVVTAKRNMWQPFLDSIGVDADDVDFD